MAPSFPTKPIHFVLAPYMAQGHIIPMLDFGRLLAESGCHVTIITTPLNVPRLQPAVDRAQSLGLVLQLFTIPFPSSAVGLPEGYENADMVPTADTMEKFFTGTYLLEEPLKEYLREEMQRMPICIVSDFSFPWTRCVCTELAIPRYVFYSVGCFTLFCQETFAGYCRREGIPDDDKRPLVVPELPHKVELSRVQVPGFWCNYVEIEKQASDAESTANGIIINSFVEMEQSYVDMYEKHKKNKIWTIGPVSLVNKELNDVANRGSKSTTNETEILGWLDTMKPNSVIYVSLGSLARTTLPQLQEIGMGLEGSGHPYVWVIRSPEHMVEIEEWLQSGFEERNKNKCFIIRGWASQVMILSHPSVGGFLTHAGWNSTMEGITAGVPMIIWPFFCDQFVNERFLVDVLGIGISIGIKEPKWWWEEMVLVKREKVEEAVRKLMEGSKDGVERRRRALELGAQAKKAMDVGGSSYENIGAFVDEVKLLLANKDPISCDIDLDS